MIQSKYLWKKQIEGIVEDQDVFRLINKNRDIDDHVAFFSMGMEAIHDPFLFRDMDKVVERVNQAIDHGENILIFGDYDCDGITSVAILYRMLKSLGAKVHYQVPNRFEDGYGLNMEIAQSIIDGGYQLVITVDNGITSVDEVDFMQKHDIDVIVTDHHQFKDHLPQAYAILHTKVSDAYPFKEIAGCMVSFKLAWALKGSFPQDLTDLAMIGTIADLMPLEDENQAMINIGLEQLKNSEHVGLRKLVSFSDLDIINQTAIAFQIAPKINSSGRLNQAELAIKLLITDDIRQANQLMMEIEENHQIRKRHTERSFNIAEALVNDNDQVLVLASEKFHEGVLGICAQRISEKYQKPTIVMIIEDNMAKGSARSFGQISILKMLEASKDLLEKFGGHHQAAGMQLKKDHIEAFRQRLNQLDIDDSDPVLDIDMEVNIDDIKKETIQRLQDKSFHTALFLIKELTVVRKQIVGKKHVKLTLATKRNTFDALKFNQLAYYYNLNEGDVIDVCGGLTINRFRNRESIQIMLTDLRCQHLQVLDYRQSRDIETVAGHLYDDFTVLNDQTIIQAPSIKKLMHDNQSFALFPKVMSLNFNLITDRNELAKVYQKLKTYHHFDKFDIIKIFNISQWMAEKIIDIFIDLKLCQQKEDTYQILETRKTDIQQSTTYQDVVDMKKTIDWLYLATSQRIKKYLEETHGL